MIKIVKVPAARSWAWIANGGRMMLTSGHVLIPASILIMVVNYYLQLSSITTYFLIFLNPFLMAGFIHLVILSRYPKVLSVKNLLKPLLTIPNAIALFFVGLFNAAISLPLMILLQNLISRYQNQEYVPPEQVLLLVFGFLLVFMATFYLLPITYFLHQRLGNAVKISFQACWRNIYPLTLFFSLSIGLLLLGTLMLGLGLIIVIPWLITSWLLSFTEIINVELDEDSKIERILQVYAQHLGIEPENIDSTQYNKVLDKYRQDKVNELFDESNKTEHPPESVTPTEPIKSTDSTEEPIKPPDLIDESTSTHPNRSKSSEDKFDA